MVSAAYELMTAFDAERRKYLLDEDYAAAFVCDDAVSFVNNVHHGISPKLWLPRVREFLVEREQVERFTEGELSAWVECLVLVDVLCMELGVEVS